MRNKLALPLKILEHGRGEAKTGGRRKKRNGGTPSAAY